MMKFARWLALIALVLAPAPALATLQAYQFQAVNLQNNEPLPGARVTVYQFGTTTPAPIFDMSGNPLSNPTTADQNGVFAFQAASTGSYQAVWSTGRYVSPLWSLTTNGAIPVITLGGTAITSCSTPPSTSLTGTTANPILNFSFPGSCNYALGPTTITACNIPPSISIGGTTANPTLNFSLPACNYTGAYPAITPAEITDFGATPQTGVAWYDTKAAFLAATLPANYSYVCVRAVSGTYPAAAGADATPLCYRPVGSATGLYGEVTVGGQLFDPVYSTKPVKFAEFGLVNDGSYSFYTGCNFNLTSTGASATVTVSSTSGCSAGMRVTTINWNTRTGKSLPIVQSGCQISSVGTLALTLSCTPPAMTSVPNAGWADNIGGTDNTAALQAALNFGMQNGYTEFEGVDGQYAYYTSLNFGWGNATYTINVHGSGRSAYAQNTPGMHLLFGAVNQPAISVQGLAKSSIRGLYLIGRNFNYAAFGQAALSTWSSNPADWLPPEFTTAPGGLSTNAPFAGVAEDPYNCSAPAVGYPARTFPSWIGGSPTNYGWSTGSTDFEIEDSEISGFGVAYVNGLATCALNGDFTKIHGLSAKMSAYDIAIVQSQSRQVDLKNISAAGQYAIVTNSAFGSAQGQFGGPMVNIASGGGYKLFDFGVMAYSGPVVIDNVYAENNVRIGDFGGNAAFPNSVIFRGGQINVGEFLHGQIPPNYITNNGPVTFSGLSFVGNQRIGLWSPGAASIKFSDGGSWQCATLAPTTTAQLLADNYTGGCLAPYVSFADALKATNWSGIGGTFGSEYLSGGFGMGARGQMTQGVGAVYDQDGRGYAITAPYQNQIDTAVTNVVSQAPSLTNDQLTFGYCSNQQAAWNLAAGQLLLHKPTSTLFVIGSIGSATANSNCSSPSTQVLVTATQQNNLSVAPGTNTFASNNIAASQITGYLTVYNGPTFTLPGHMYFGQFTSGSASVTNVEDSTGSGGSLTGAISVGDALVGPGYPGSGQGLFSAWGASSGVGWPIPAAGLTVSAVTNGSPGSLTLSGNAQATCYCPIFPFELRP